MCELCDFREMERVIFFWSIDTMIEVYQFLMTWFDKTMKYYGVETIKNFNGYLILRCELLTNVSRQDGPFN